MAPMRCRTRLPLAVALAAAALLAPPAARADFTYSDAVTPNTTTSGGSVLSLTGVTSATVLSGTTNINLVKVALSSTTPAPATDSFVVGFTNMLQITNIQSPSVQAVGALSLTGTLNFTRSDSGGEFSVLQLSSGSTMSMVLNSVRYTISNITYTPPTVNSPAGAGNISALITSSAVPEPTTLGLLATGLLGVVAHRRRRI